MPRCTGRASFSRGGPLFPRPDFPSCDGGAARKSIGKSHGIKIPRERKGGGKWPRNCMKLLDLMLVNQDFFCLEEMGETWNVGFLMCDLDKGPVIQCTTVYRRYGGCTNWMFNLYWSSREILVAIKIVKSRWLSFSGVLFKSTMKRYCRVRIKFVVQRRLGW